MFKDIDTIDKFTRRRELVFIILSGLFLGTLSMLNILGISRFINMDFAVFGVNIPFTIAVGVLPYPITFLCTDFISELYGKKRANMVVWGGFILNVWIVLILWIGGYLNAPPLDSTGMPVIAENPDGFIDMPHDYAFYRIRALTFGSVFASMIAYLAAQFIDVRVFHFLKKKTKGKYLWLRNNASTLVSQLVDTIAVICITHFYAHGLPLDGERSLFHNLMIFILSGYVFKIVAALVDTIPFYIGVKFLSKYLNIDPNRKYKVK